jgi:hypothetical protein
MLIQLMKIKNFFLFIIASTILLSCKSRYDFKGYLKSNAAGAISGKEWAYIYAYTDADAKLPEGQEYLIVLVSEQPKNACPEKGEKVGDGREILITIDGRKGEMKIGARSSRLETEDDMFEQVKESRHTSVAFYDPTLSKNKQYRFAKSGKVKINKINSEVIQGSVIAKINKKVFINGRFEAKICKYGQLN